MMKTLPVIRHLRWLIRTCWNNRNRRRWARMHGDMPYVVNKDQERAAADAIWEGRE